MNSEAKQLINKLVDGEFIPSAQLKQLLENYEGYTDEAWETWQSRVTKARKDKTYQQGVFLVCWLNGTTPQQIIDDVLDDIKKISKMVRAEEAAIDLITFIKHVGKLKDTPFAPKSQAVRVSGFMSFISRVSGYPLPKNVLALYQQFQSPSDEHIGRKQLTTEELYKACDHATVTEKALMLFLVQTGLSRADIPHVRVPQGFFEQLEKSAAEGLPTPMLSPMGWFTYKRQKTSETTKPTFGSPIIFGDAAKWYLKYAEQKGITDGDPFFIGHNREPLSSDGVYSAIAGKSSVRSRSKIKHLTPKALREYNGGVLKSAKINPDVIAIMTAHRGGDVAEAYTFKRDIIKAAVDVWESFNPDLFRERRAVEAEQETKNTREELRELKGEFQEFKDLMLQFLTAQPGGKAEAFERLTSPEG